MSLENRFIVMIREYEAVIFKITTIYTRSASDQKDLYQEIVLQLWRAFESFREESKVSTWLYRVAMNTAISRLRKEKRREKTLPINQVVLNYTTPSNSEFEERISLLYRHIEDLNDLDKGLILLYLEDKSYEEMAEITGLSASNVGTRLSRIKQKLKSKVKHAQTSR